MLVSYHLQLTRKSVFDGVSHPFTVHCDPPFVTTTMAQRYSMNNGHDWYEAPYDASQDSTYGVCPLCQGMFPVADLPVHCDDCDGTTAAPAGAASSPPQHVCPLCNDLFPTVAALQDHCEDCDGAPPPPSPTVAAPPPPVAAAPQPSDLACPLCNVIFASASRLREHAAECDGPPAAQPPAAPLQDSYTSILNKCRVCSRTFTYANDLRDHSLICKPMAYASEPAPAAPPAAASPAASRGGQQAKPKPAPLDVPNQRPSAPAAPRPEEVEETVVTHLAGLFTNLSRDIISAVVRRQPEFESTASQNAIFNRLSKMS